MTTSTVQTSSMALDGHYTLRPGVRASVGGQRPVLGGGRLGRLLREAGCSRKVIAHCRAVRDCACEYAARCPDADFSLVETGAWLHDIGRSIDHSIRHAQAGADLLRSHNFP